MVLGGYREGAAEETREPGLLQEPHRPYAG